jgi:GDPmannose 4,6-dehydratase
MKRALIIGVTGQDGTLLAQQLESQGIDLAGLSSAGMVGADGRVIQAGKLTDPEFMRQVVQASPPSHVFYLAAHHHSSQDAELAKDAGLWKSSLDVQVLGLVNVLEALRRFAREARLFYAASSHIFGTPAESPQNEKTLPVPNNVYGATKKMGIDVCHYYRRQHGIFASVGILYNHESVYRKEKFLSQKIIRGALEIKSGRAKSLVLGDLSARVDWGYAPDYVDAMVRILTLAEPGDFVIATGEAHTVRDFVSLVFEKLGLDYREWVAEDPSIIRKSNAVLIGNASKLRRETGWAPSLSFPEMVRLLTSETQQRVSEANE